MMDGSRICIEDKAVLDSHVNSWIVKYLMEHGFSDDTPESYHREGPWLWVDVEKMKFRYHPRYAVRCYDRFGGITLSGSDFCAIWEIFERRHKVLARTGNDWAARIEGDGGNERVES